MCLELVLQVRLDLLDLQEMHLVQVQQALQGTQEDPLETRARRALPALQERRARRVLQAGQERRAPLVLAALRARQAQQAQPAQPASQAPQVQPE